MKNPESLFGGWELGLQYFMSDRFHYLSSSSVLKTKESLLLDRNEISHKIFSNPYLTDSYLKIIYI